MSTRPTRQNRSTYSRMSVPSEQKQKLSRCHVPLLAPVPKVLEANREKRVNHFTLRMTIILMETIKDPYSISPRVSAPFLVARLTRRRVSAIRALPDLCRGIVSGRLEFAL